MTREEILEAAAQIFSQKGYHAASMQDIASLVNLQKASLYHHVSSKQEILLALLDLERWWVMRGGDFAMGATLVASGRKKPL